MSQHDALDAQARLLEKLRARKRAAANKGADKAAAEPSRPKVVQPVDRSQPLRLSFGQERLWLLDRLAPGGNAFHMAFPLRIRGRLDVEALRRAVHDLVARHEMLRTVFVEIDGEPRQRVLDMAEAPEAAALRMVDLSDLDPAARDARTREIRQADGVEPFDLSTGPLYRATLIILEGERFELLQTMHHIVSDGWSTGLIFRDLGRLLDAHSRGVEPDLPPITVQYVDVAAHQREQLSGETLDRLVDYWRKTLDGAPQTLALPLDRPRPANSSHRGDGVEATIPSALATELGALARAERTSLFTVLLTAFDLLIARLAGQDDVLVGSPVAGRQTLETEPLVGFFLNTLILRAEIDPEASFRTLLRAVRGQVMSATQHQDVPFEKLLEELQPERHMSLSPFFQVLFNMANLPDVQLRLPGVTVELVTLVPAESKFDLTVYVFEGAMSHSAEALRLIWVYDTELFDRARIEVMVEQYLDVLGQIVADPDRAVARLDLVTDGSRQRLPDPKMPLDAPWRESVPAAVARHATATPERIALVDSRTGVTTTYAELHERSRRIARRLAANGIRRGDVVAIWAHRSTPLVEALVGLLDAGAAFTLFDPTYPISRLLDYVDLADPRGLIALDDAGPLPDELVDALTSRCRDEAGDRWLTLGPPGTSLDGSSDDDAWSGIDLGADDLAYVAFTSGSTGKPKAVLGRHGPLLHLIPSFAADFDLGADDRHALLSALAHDPLHRDVFHPLGFGATLAVPDPERIGAPGYLADWLVEEGVTVANLVPAMLQMLCASARENTELSQLRRVFTVGEVLTRADVDALYALAPEATCVNLYGATETQRAVGHVVIPRRPDLDAKRPGGTGGLAKAALPLGRGVEATQLLVLGPDDRLAGIGEPGEIAVRSPLLARGYSDPEATRERFVTNPFTGRADDRIYRTGDLGRYLPNGDVEYIGRADSQVKVRGFRIELQEIEVVLASLPTIRESVVVVRDDDASGPYLAAYVVAENGVAEDGVVEGGVAADGTDADPRAWRAAIAERLPDYMVPAAWVVLDALPKTGTGKLDRRALPEPDRQLAAVEHRPPTRPAERQLAEHWKAVLDIEQVGLDDHFFELGGHSLLATRLLARLRDDLGIELPLRAVFDHPQLEAMAAAIAALDPAHAASMAIPRVERGGPLVTSFAQRRLWFLDRLETDSAAYVLSAGIRLLGPLDAAHLQRALDQLVERHETLRTRIVTLDDGEPAQLVDPPAPQALPSIDLRSLGPTDALAEARRLAGEETRRPMDLAAGPLLRTTLLHLDADDHALLLSMHHVISDGWSIGIFFRELSALYQAAVEGREADLPSMPLQYVDFAAWEGDRLRGESLDHLLGFWREHLAGAPTALELPTDRPRPAQQTFVGTRLPIALSSELSARVGACSRALDATPFMTLLAAWSLLLGRHAGQEEVVVGTPVAHRERTELESLIGFFANTLPIRTVLDGVTTFAELVAQVRRSTLDALAHQDLPFEKLVVELDVERDLSRSPIFQVLFSMQNLDAIGLQLGDLHLSGLDTDYGRSQFDINLVLSERPDDGAEGGTSLSGWFEYNTDLFDAVTIDAYARRFVHLLDQLTADPRQRLDQVDLLDADERSTVLQAWNDTARERPASTLHQLIAERAAVDPERAAVTGLGGAHDGVTWTYGDLLARARRIGHHLRDAGAGPDQLVGVLLHRSPDALAVLLGILEAGAGYLPLDPDYPSDRLSYMVESSGATLVVTDGELPESTGLDTLATSRGVRFVRLDAEAETIASRPDAPLDVAVDPENLAYAIYTSGSTGLPKGVQIPHRAIVNFLRSMAVEPGLDADDVLLSVTTLSFDIAGLEHFLPLAVGARVVIADRSITGDGLALRDVLADPAHGLTVMQATPATWRMLVDAGWQGTDGLEVLCGGEALPADLARELTARSAELWNVYGPTETTVWSTTRQVLAGDESPHGGATVTVGFPIDNTTVYLLDAHGQPVPPGAVGELLIGGDGLARGYRGRGDLTAERFVPHPFGDGERLYRTGDLARHRLTADGRGDLEFLGRLDHQVKVRGFRIELGEIESVLREHASVDQAVVMARTDGGDTRLVGYVVAAAAAEIDTEALRRHLGASLPDYMVPALFVALGILPLTPNGKVDRKALPAPDVAASAAVYAAPEGEAETMLATLWAEILEVERVGRHDHFFGLGGHSLLAVRLLARLRQATGVALPVRVVFEAPTLAEMAHAFITEKASESSAHQQPPISTIEPDGLLPVSSAQSRLWFLDQLEPASTAYVLSTNLRLSGPFDRDVLANALDRLIERQESLRTRIVTHRGEPVQVVDPPSRGHLRWIDLSDRGTDDALAEARCLATLDSREPMSLDNGPLLRATLVRLAAEDHALLISVHHIVSDGWSVRLFFRELAELVAAEMEGRADTLPALSVQYADFATWENRRLTGETLARQLDFWRAHLAGAPAALELPTDRPRPAQRTLNGARLALTLPATLGARLDACSRTLDATPFMTLLATWSLLLGRHAGQSDVVVGTPVAQREHVEIEHLIGFFANTLALRTRLDGGRFAELVAQVRRSTLDALAHQDLPFEKLVAELDIERDLSRSPIFQAMFSMQNLDTVDGRLGDAQLSALGADTSRSQVDLHLLLHDDAGSTLNGWLEYNTDLFDAATIEAYARRFVHLLDQLTADPQQRLDQVDLLDADERSTVLDAWNDTARDLPAVTLHQLIAERAAVDPERAAVTGLGGAHDGVTWTYGDVLARARRIARHLRDAGAGPDQLVGVLLHRSPDALAVLLGILEAGAGYLPLDPDYPSDRLAYMVESSGATLVVTDGELPESTGLDTLATSRGVRFVRLDAEAAAIEEQSGAPLDVAVDPENLAYAIYTSGSTGLPKGVQIPHRAIVNFLRSMAFEPGLDADDVLLSVTTLSFDIAGLEHFLPLAVGARVVIADRSITGDGLALRDVLADPAHGLTVMQATPATWRMLVDAGWQGTDGLKVLCGGEALPADLARELAARSAELWNVYGPTETTVWSTTRRVTAGDESPHGGATVTVGFPIDNTMVYLLDAHGQPVPPGAVGELLIGGAGLARGYRGRGDLTAERFVPHPFGDGERLYRTGDLARHRLTPDGRGDLEFLGRLDHQVKVRGFRIELGEIESVLRERSDVDQAVVMARTDAGDTRLVGYIVPTDLDIDTEALRRHLGASLPDYMVPALFVTLGTLPLTPNGKVDRKALPAPDVAASAAEYAAPEGEAETMLATLWAEILEVERVGRQDHFFGLGGHSLLAVRLLARLRRTIGITLPVRIVFEAPTLAGMATVLSEAMAADRQGPDDPPPIVAQSDEGMAPVSFSQQRLWFVDQMAPGISAYHVRIALRLRGALDHDALRRAIGDLVERHAALRTRIVTVDDEPRQVVDPPTAITLTTEDLRGADAVDAAIRRVDEVSAEAFDLANGPLVRFLLLQLDDEDHAFLVVAHHIVTDGESSRILLRELDAAYTAHAAGAAVDLPDLACRFTDFAVWEQNWLRDDVLDRQIAFWRDHLADAPTVLTIPTDRPRPAMQTFAGARVEIDLGAERARACHALARRLGATPFMLLLAGWADLLGRWAGQDQVVLATPVAHRPRTELEGVVGFFANTLPLVTDLAGDPTLDELVGRVRQAVLDAFAHDHLPFEKLVAELDIERDPAFPPIAQATFGLTYDLDTDVRLGTLAAEGFGPASLGAKHDLHLDLYLGTGQLDGSIIYNRDLFDGDTIDRLAERLRLWLDAVIASSDRRRSSIDLRDAHDRAMLGTLVDRRPFRDAITARELFETSADRHGERLAVSYADATLHYAELEARANRLAHLLIERGVGPGHVVGLLFDRSAALITAMLAVAKADAASVCLDPAYPADRLVYTLTDAAITTLVGTSEHLTDRALDDQLVAGGLAVDRLAVDDDVIRDALASHSADRPPRRGVPGATAYLVYTSGSTGRPKASVISSRALARLVDCPFTGDLGPEDVVSQSASPAFDAAAWEIWATLSHGAHLVGLDADTLMDPNRLDERLRETGVTVLFLTTALLHQVAEQRPSVLAGRRAVLFGGERCEPRWIRAARAAFDGRLLHLYGPSECTTYATWFEVEEVGADAVSVPIGGPVGNTSIHVVDAQGLPCPIGVPGELWIGGEGLSDGYLGRPALTAEKFVPSPEATEPGQRLYRTGDLVRVLPTGALDFLGRIDRQIKLRGFRIELGEVEAALAALPAVGQALLRLLDDGEPRLVAWVTPAADGSRDAPASASLSPAALRDALRQQLPAFMVPSVIVVLDAFPLTANGKIDQRALPTPEALSADEHRPPRSDEEHAIAAVWAEVLGLDRVGLDDDFFALGGHSLLATRVLSRTRDALGHDVPLTTLFEHPRFEEFVAAASSLRQPAGLEPPPLVRLDDDGPAPASFSQQRLWFIDRMAPGGTAYHVRIALRLRGPLDHDAMRRAVDDLVERHASLRTRIVAVDDAPRQIVDPPTAVTLTIEDVRGPGALDAATRRVDEASSEPFDLAAGPLARFLLVQIDGQDHALLVVVHHIVTDGESSRILLRELDAAYRAHTAGDAVELPALACRFTDFAAWEQAWLQDAVLDHQLAFWRDHLADAPTVLTLPTDRPRPPVQTFDGAQVRLDLGGERARACQDLARRLGATPFMLLLAGWADLLGRWAGQDQVVLATPVAHRPRTELEGVVGFFANTLPLATDLAGDPTLDELIGRVRRAVLGAFAHDHLPFEKLVAELDVERDPAFPPIAQATFGLIHDLDADVHLGELAIEGFGSASLGAKHDLHLELYLGSDRHDADQLAGSIVYNRDLFEPSTIERLGERLSTWLDAVIASTDRRRSSIDLRDAADHALQATLIDRRPFRDAWTPRQLFEASVDHHGDRPALAFDEGRMTYDELETRANRFAHQLIERGIGPGKVVGVLLERSTALVVSLLAIAKADATYVCLDPAYPEDRLRWMSQDADLSLLVGRASTLAVVPDIDCPTVDLDAIDEALAASSAARPPQRGVAEAPAYLIYTSGSTGLPKASVITARSLARLVDCPFTSDLGPTDVMAHLASPAFDAAAWELWAAFAHGAEVVGISKDDLIDPARLERRLREHGVTTAFFTTALMHQLAEQRPAIFADLRTVAFGGERCEPKWVRAVRQAFDGRLLHVYGPSECTTYASVFPVDEVAENAASVSIGGPIGNTELHVVDAYGQPCPTGVPGELWIGGSCLSDGYLGRPRLTAEKFIPHPSSDQPGARLYRSGDRVRVLADGTLDFIGRIDRQIKLRGFRVEIGEVETALSAHPEVGRAHVLLRTDDEPRLVAYVTPADKTPPTDDALRAFVHDRLPSYMVPSAILVLDVLPLTANGKVDHRALPAPTIREDRFRPPVGVEQELVAAAWAEVLGVERVGLDDDFFGLGGHSLLAARLLSRVRDALGIDVPIKTLFEHPRLEAFVAAAIAHGRRDAGLEPPPPERVERDGPLATSFSQQRLWFIDRMSPEEAAYNIPQPLRLRGALDVPALGDALDDLVARHEALRTRIETIDGEPRQVIDPPTARPLEVEDLRAAGDATSIEEAARRRAAEEADRPFDLAAEPLERHRLLKLAEDDHVLLFTLHHAITDGLSMEILTDELAVLYRARRAGLPAELPSLAFQFADFAAWERAWLQGEALDQQLDFWRRHLADAPPVLRLPTDHARPAMQNFVGAQVSIDFGAALGREVRELAHRLGATPFMVLVAGWAMLLGRWAGQERVVLGTTVGHRPNTVWERVVGFFANTLALSTDLGGAPSFETLVERVRAVVLDAFAHQDLPFEKLVAELDIERDPSTPPIYQASFGLHEIGDDARRFADLDLDGFSIGTPQAKDDLHLAVGLGEDAFVATIVYNVDLFTDATMARLAERLRHVLGQALAEPERSIVDLDACLDADRQVLAAVNANRRELHDATVVERFEAWADRDPERPAIAYHDARLTYGELDREANRIANRLIERGIAPETLVGICLDRSARLVTTFLAVFKAGAGYVYLDPKYPAERLQQMIEDTRPPVLITQASLDAMLGEALASDPDAAATPRWVLDRDADLADADTTRPPRRVDGDNLALVVYTSGSTGRAKGSGVTYRNVARTVLELEERYFDLREDDVFMQGATPSFDVAIWEIWAPLTHGAALVGAERDELLNLATLDAKLRREGVTVADFMTALLHQIAEERPSMFADLRAITFGGERCDPRWVRVVRASTDARLVHCYGPTECTTTATAFDVDEVAEDAASVPIGPPTTNTEILVLDRHGQPCPVGVPGELCLGGSGLVRGYLLRSRLTAEKFVPHPTGDGHDGPGARVYRTGDLVRLLPSGALDFLGRIDRQVKIRGFRIEPGEVEATLAAHPAVGRAVVIVREAENDRHLIAYATPEEGGERPSVETLLHHLRDELPAFMQPAAVMVLDALPFTAHGKVDQRALPAPELRRAEARRDAETALERFLGDLWASVLKLDTAPALDDDFFDLGGHSLLAAKVFSRLNEAVVVEVPLRLLFDHPHLGSFAKALEGHLGDSDAGRQALDLIELMDSMSDDDAETLMGSDD